MMRIILLLLVALTGPLCTFTRASTLVVPTESVQNVTTATEPAQTAVTKQEEEQAPLSTEAPVPPEVTTAYEAVVSTEAQGTEAQSEGPGEETTSTNLPPEGGAEEPHTTESHTTVGVPENSTVRVEDKEAPGTGQVVGIVIGALIAVIVVIAVIILVVRRMGQYSP